jgi:hypothetical protein
MAIRKRELPANSPIMENETAPKKFPTIEAKPKKPVENTGFFKNMDSLDGATARGFGNLAAACGDLPDLIPLSIADRFKLLRTPFDKSTPTEQRYRNRVRNRHTAITAMCIVCTGSRKLVTECADVTCPLWAFRFGRNPYRSRK